jgi:hypothetical protein
MENSQRLALDLFSGLKGPISHSSSPEPLPWLEGVWYPNLIMLISGSI